MHSRPPSLARFWLGLAICTFVYFAATTWTRVRVVEAITSIGNESVAPDAHSTTGYAGNVRQLIIPGHSENSYRWIAQTQAMLAQHVLHLRQIDYDNAPQGHAVSSASAYRWWLGSLAWIDHFLSGRPIGLCVEDVAVWSDPLALGLFLIGIFALVVSEFGLFTGAFTCWAVVTFFPWISNFVPGRPDSETIGLLLMVFSVALLLPAFREFPDKETSRSTRLWFFWAGFAGGLGMWVNLPNQLVVEMSVATGAILATWLLRANPVERVQISFAWRFWSWGGALASLLAYGLERAPDQLGSWTGSSLHPLYAVAWVGLGELLYRISQFESLRKSNPEYRASWIRFAVAVVAVGMLPALYWQKHLQGLFSVPSSLQLSRALTTDVASGVWAWLLKDGISRTVWATFLPLFFAALGGWMLARKTTSSRVKASLALTLLPLLAALPFAWHNLSLWSYVDALILPVLIVVLADISSGAPPRVRLFGAIATSTVFVVEAISFWPRSIPSADRVSINATEARELVERDLAHWLSKQGTAAPVIFAPANDTSALCYYGNVRGLATLDQDNKDGLVAAVRIASATSTQEARELIEKREITHVIIPSWDTQLDDYARLGVGQVAGSFIETLDQLNLPAWLRPIPYQLPHFAGEKNESVTILAVVDDQDDAVSFGRLTDFDIETGRLDLLPSAILNLRRFPGDVGALAAVANAQLALNDQDALQQTLQSLANRLHARSQRPIPWDRRVSLAVLLARTNRMDLAKEQAQRCFAEATEARLKQLTSASLYHLFILGKGLGLRFPNQQLESQAMDLLPPEARERLHQLK